MLTEVKSLQGTELRNHFMNYLLFLAATELNR